MQMTTRAIVLSVRNIDEDDRLLTLLTEDFGVISAYAKGASRMKNQLAPFTNLLCCSNMVLFKNRDRYSLNSADGIDMFFGLRKDLDKLALATYFAELTATLAPHEEKCPDYMRLLLNTLSFLESGKRSILFLKPVYELRALTLGGFMPDLVACKECGAFDVEPMYLSLKSGELCCANCFADTAEPTVRLNRGVLSSMRHIIYSDFKKLFAFTLPDEGLRQLGTATEQYLSYQTDRTFKSLDFYHSLKAL